MIKALQRIARALERLSETAELTFEDQQDQLSQRELAQVREDIQEHFDKWEDSL